MAIAQVVPPRPPKRRAGCRRSELLDQYPVVKLWGRSTESDLTNSSDRMGEITATTAMTTGVLTVVSVTCPNLRGARCGAGPGPNILAVKKVRASASPSSISWPRSTSGSRGSAGRSRAHRTPDPGIWRRVAVMARSAEIYAQHRARVRRLEGHFSLRKTLEASGDFRPRAGHTPATRPRPPSTRRYSSPPTKSNTPHPSTPSPSTSPTTPKPKTNTPPNIHSHRHHPIRHPPLTPNNPTRHRHLPPSGKHPERRAHDEPRRRQIPSCPACRREGDEDSVLGASTTVRPETGPST